jgi:hypothetical protein
MLRYFDRSCPLNVYWFGQFTILTDTMGFSYRSGRAVHLDLSQETTATRWRDLGEMECRELLANDLPFLKWVLETFPLKTLLCVGPTPFHHICNLAHVSEIRGQRTCQGNIGNRTIAITRL